MSLDILDYVQTISTQIYPRGHWVFKESDDSEECMFFIFAGTIGFYKKMGRDSIKLSEMNAGHFFGEIALIKSVKRTAGAKVESENAKIARLDKRTFIQISKNAPEFLFELLKQSIDRQIMAEARLKKITEGSHS